MKRIIIVLLVVILAIGVIAAGIFFRKRSGGEDAGPNGLLPAPGTSITGGVGVIPGPGEPGSTASSTGINTFGWGSVSRASVVDYTLDSQSNVLILDTNNNILSVSSSEIVIAKAEFEDILGGWFSPDGSWLLIEHGAPEESQWSLLDIAKRTWRDLNMRTFAATWSPNGQQLAYFARRTSGIALTTYDPKKNTTKTLLSLAAPDLVPYWQDESHVLFSDRPSGLVSADIQRYSLASGEISIFAKNVAGGQLLWGEKQNGGLLFGAGSAGGTLRLVDDKGTGLQTFAFLTMPSKCVFGNTPSAVSSTPEMENYLMCGIPQDPSIMKKVRLPDAYLKKEYGTVDTFYIINITNGALTAIVPPEQQKFVYEVSNPKVFKNVLYFVNRNNQKLYSATIRNFDLIQ